MRIAHGAEVVDKDGRILGLVDYVIPDMMTGETRKFKVGRKSPEPDLFFKPEDVLEADSRQVKLRVSHDVPS
ncbi:MAG: hypothetical protein IBX68_12305 [Dehalococcoidia bacterium]|nr:hypothetical protein [Dehalococcoidia bacterium]